MEDIYQAVKQWGKYSPLEWTVSHTTQWRHLCVCTLIDDRNQTITTRAVAWLLYKTCLTSRTKISLDKKPLQIQAESCNFILNPTLTSTNCHLMFQLLWLPRWPTTAVCHRLCKEDFPKHEEERKRVETAQKFLNFSRFLFTITILFFRRI